MTAQIVIGLGFGDEGKGITTDYLCSQNPDSIVVRFSGGQQAGHTVILDGMKHVHSNFGSGTMRNIPSYFSEHCSIYLNTIDRERQVLLTKGIIPSLFVHPLVKLTTPYDVAFNRLREAEVKHGSCGLGIGTTMKRHNETGYKLFAVDLLCPKLLLEKLKQISLYYEQIVPKDNWIKYAEIVEKETISFNALIFGYPFEIIGYEKLKKYSNVIFEGSQGILLDMSHGIFPHVTYAETTSKNALNICHNIGAKPELYYITRCYQTRHGNGWMSNECELNLINNEHEINKLNQWQGNFRIGELDYDLLNYSLCIDEIYAKTYQKNLVVTCLDQRPDFLFQQEKLKTRFRNTYYSYSPESKYYVKKEAAGNQFISL